MILIVPPSSQKKKLEEEDAKRVCVCVRARVRACVQHNIRCTYYTKYPAQLPTRLSVSQENSGVCGEEKMHPAKDEP